MAKIKKIKTIKAQNHTENKKQKQNPLQLSDGEHVRGTPISIGGVFKYVRVCVHHLIFFSVLFL